MQHMVCLHCFHPGPQIAHPTFHCIHSWTPISSETVLSLQEEMASWETSSIYPVLCSPVPQTLVKAKCTRVQSLLLGDRTMRWTVVRTRKGMKSWPDGQQVRAHIHELIFFSTGFVKKMMSHFPDLTCSCIKRGLHPGGAGTAQSGEEKAQGSFYQCVQIPGGRVQRRWSLALLTGAQWQDQRQRVQTATQKVHSPHIRKHFLTLRVAEPWHRLPREALESPDLGLLRCCLDVVLCSWL